MRGGTHRVERRGAVRGRVALRGPRAFFQVLEVDNVNAAEDGQSFVRAAAQLGRASYDEAREGKKTSHPASALELDLLSGTRSNFVGFLQSTKHRN